MILVGWREFFIFPFDGTSSSEDSPSLLELLNDDESSDSGFVVCCAACFNLEEDSDEPFPAEPQGDLWTFLQLESAGCFDFEEGLGDLSTLCDWNHQDHFLIWLHLTSLECPQV